MSRKILWCLLMLAAPIASAQEGCSADQAAASGYVSFGDFHNIMAPAWHTAWPAKDYAALIAAGPKFTEQFKAIAQMNPEQVSPTRRPSFIEQRQLFAELVEKYANACRQSDSEQVYKLMPDLHTAFEATAATLLPVSYPEFDGLMVTIDLIVQHHLPDRNIEGLVASTETLRTKMEHLIAAELPEALEADEEKLRPALEMLWHLVLHMLQAMYQDDIHEYIIYATELKTQADEFIWLNL
ncbi:MAG: hypothetical protein OEV49_02840 [candidate division Zixibacteria bacterium]|nr:hypothetical protein [candidate division Zixibacteria bacterium]MDH3937421.1 hypothetical protein [candidate division Zixibacteria bacterium]MDH4034427.1 hypothetical protein [candidate division Zixibacteria bacterium]